MLQEISPQEVSDRLARGEIRLVDIREPDEYRAASIPGTELKPLSTLGRYPLEQQGVPVVFTCQSGRRTKANASLLENITQDPAYMMLGGVTGWKNADLPVDEEPNYLPLFRQIQIGAGSLILLGLLLGLVWPAALWLSAFVGAGLVFAGVSGFCGLGIVLSRMPWNIGRISCACRK